MGNPREEVTVEGGSVYINAVARSIVLSGPCDWVTLYNADAIDVRFSTNIETADFVYDNNRPFLPGQTALTLASVGDGFYKRIVLATQAGATTVHWTSGRV